MDYDSIISGIAVGLVTSWIVGVSTAIVAGQIGRIRMKRDINELFSAHRKHLAREHKVVVTDHGEVVRPHSMAPKTIQED